MKPSFTYDRNSHPIAKGGYGHIYLSKIPEREIHKKKRKTRKKRRKKEIQIIKKEFKTENALVGEIHYFNTLSAAIKNKYFPLFHRAYKRKVNANFINFFEEQICHKTDSTVYGIDMEYVHPSRWELLKNLFQKDDKRLDNVFRQLIHFQLKLIKDEGAIYYDISPYNIFVCKVTNEIRMVDYGGLFIPDDPQTLHEGHLATRYLNQKFPNPFNKKLPLTNTTYYGNTYFKGPLTKNHHQKVIPALYAIIITVHMCLKAMVHPRQDLSYFEASIKKSQNIFINTLLNNPDIVQDWTLIDGGGNGN